MELDDETFLLISNNYSTANVYKMCDQTTIECIKSFEVQMVYCLLKLSNDSTFLFGMSDGTIEERSLEECNKTLHTLQDHKMGVTCLCELSNGNVVSGSHDGWLKMWDMDTKQLICTINEYMPELYITAVTELRDQTVACTTNHDIKIWKVSHSLIIDSLLRVLTIPNTSFDSLVALSDGTLLSGGCIDGTIVVWNEQGECVSTQTYSVQSMKLLRDGETLAIITVEDVDLRKTWMSLQPMLMVLCCQFIVKHPLKYDMEALEVSLPRELYDLILTTQQSMEEKERKQIGMEPFDYTCYYYE
eukprot:TRINITY_DN2229_c0_g1_i4.p1 TRINITY_DN2229_c0_g1~~TRINITY_DN2229_c0_g1_i4.p1  ORF type:complete len:302 (-),score=43.38 TRINITY_DN2229_c0_g1_i4:25-930(-)